jgi:hypothetical protein
MPDNKSVTTQYSGASVDLNIFSPPSPHGLSTVSYHGFNALSVTTKGTPKMKRYIGRNYSRLEPIIILKKVCLILASHKFHQRLLDSPNFDFLLSEGGGDSQTSDLAPRRSLVRTEADLVDPIGIEPTTSCMPCKRSPS